MTGHEMQAADTLDEDEDDREPTQVTRVLADFEACVDRSRETMVQADAVSARALRLVKRKRDTPSHVFAAVRESVRPKTQDG